MNRLCRVVSLLVLVALVSSAAGQKKKDDFREPTQQWVGVLKDAKLKAAAKDVDVITDAAAFEKLWKAWQPKAQLPKVDFATHFVVVVVSEYEPLYLSLYGGPQWKRSNSNKSPQQIKGGFGWGIGVFDRKGVAEVNGKKLEAPKEK